MKKIVAALLALILTGCATYSPKNIVRTEIDAHRYFSAAIILKDMHHTDPSGAEELLRSSDMRQAAPLLAGQAISSIEAAPSLPEYIAVGYFDTAELLTRKGIISEQDFRSVRDALANKVRGFILAGQGETYDADFFDRFPDLGTDDFLRIRYKALRWQINEINSRQSADLSKKAVAFAHVAHLLGKNSQEYREYAKLLPALHLAKKDLTSGPIQKFFPQVAENILRDKQIILFVSLTPDDPLLADDLSKLIGNHEWTSLQTSAYVGKGVHVAIKKLRFDEKSQPSRSETQTIANMNLGFGAMLLVPRGAAMQYDVLHDEATIDYGFEYTIIKDGKSIKRQLVRDRISETSHQCSNMRYINVFGGVNAIDFYPNDSVQSYCLSNSGRVDSNTLREKAYSTLVDKIKDDMPEPEIASPIRS